MAVSRGLNPQAPDYIPLAYRSTTSIPYPDVPLPPLLDLSIVPVFSSSTSFYYASPPPPSHLAAAATTSYPIQPQNPNLFLPPTLPHPAVEPPAAAAMAVTERAGRRGQWKAKGLGRGRGGKREGFLRRREACSERNQNQLHNNSRVLLKKHEVLPLTSSEVKTTTTVMIKNIPKEYSRELILKFLDEHCELENRKSKRKGSEEAGDDAVSAYDFMYLPIDFRSGCSRGYAFVNFTEARAVWKFYKACNRKPWDFFQSPKIREIVCAMIQGKEALVRHFEKSTFWCGSDELLPVCFTPPRDGSGELVQETKIGRRIATTTITASSF